MWVLVFVYMSVLGTSWMVGKGPSLAQLLGFELLPPPSIFVCLYLEIRLHSVAQAGLELKDPLASLPGAGIRPCHHALLACRAILTAFLLVRRERALGDQLLSFHHAAVVGAPLLEIVLSPAVRQVPVITHAPAPAPLSPAGFRTQVLGFHSKCCLSHLPVLLYFILF